MRPIGKRAQQILDFILEYHGRHGFSPCIREIGEATGLASSSTVHAHLQTLERLGKLERTPGHPRSLRPVDPLATPDEMRDLLRECVGFLTGSLRDRVELAIGGPAIAVWGVR